MQVTSHTQSAVPERIIVLANRAPFRHELGRNGRPEVTRSASGLVTALEPLVEAYSGTWVAYGTGTADQGGVGGRASLQVPPANPRYRIRYVGLDEHEHRGYYYGFANEGLWPLCHDVNVPAVFRAHDFRMYRQANAHFAAAVGEAADDRPAVVFVQDYHFALAPRMVRARLAASTVIAFWHIPFPDPHVFRTCPWRRELLDGLLGADLLGFQTPQDVENFLQTVDATLAAEVDYDERTVAFRGRRTRVRAYPVGIEWNNPHARAGSIDECRASVACELGLSDGMRLGVGIDRLDYTKGIAGKFQTIERLLEHNADLRGRLVFVQVAEPSRDCLPAYRTARDEIAATAARINARFGGPSYQPIVLRERHHEPGEVYRLYKAADFCYVNSLRDGMNLVAKEFVAARRDGRGVLVLCQYTGAAPQLQDAVIVDPYSIEASAAALERALQMPPAEQRRRLERMQTAVAAFDTYWWADQIMHDALHPRSARPAKAAAGVRALTRLSA
jgi:trehalose 6-phosphate synthase